MVARLCRTPLPWDGTDGSDGPMVVDGDETAYLTVPAGRHAVCLERPDVLRADPAAVRERGYGVFDEDVLTDVAAIGAPVLDATGRCVAALSLAGPSKRVLPVRPEQRDRLLRVAADVTHRRPHRHS